MTEEIENPEVEEIEKKFALFDADGLPVAFYSSTIHGDNIPEGCVEISQEQWENFVDNSGLRKWQDGQIIEYTPVITVEQKWAMIRAERDSLLSASDWTMLTDSPLSDEQKNAWKSYRQELRDIMESQDPDNIAWPEKPE